MSERLSSLFAGVVLVGAAAALFVPDALSGGPGEVPDPALTPGLVASTSAAEVCSIYASYPPQTYSQAHRQTTREMKEKVAEEYHLSRSQWHSVEFDHRVSLCLGGADDVRNLWPQSLSGPWNAHDKDRLETELCRRVCHGTMALDQAQSVLLGDWRDGYTQIFGGSPPSAH